jgi:hypothetical protein
MPDTSPRRVPGAPGAISLFFVAKAALFGAVCWAWLLYLLGRGPGPATGWELFAAGAGICFTLVAVLLGVRYATERAAAARHAELVREIADLSWHAVAQATRTPENPDGNVFTMPGSRDRTHR